ncbi:MAG: methylenetetrahydrofolate reductase [Alphaproteobacteria bacterium]|nr:methylenetetrahydrofolate reductase [Alphaproteobacteria bacterium]
MDQIVDGLIVASPAEAQARAERIRALVGSAALDVSARDRSADAVCRDRLAPGTPVYINHTLGDTTQDIVAAATRLRRAGFVPVPHVAARHLAGFTRLNDYLAQAAGEAGVDQVLLVAGDVEQPVGPYGSCLDVIATGLLQKHGIRRVGLAAYPEGHRQIATSALDAALAAKLAALRAARLAPYVVTQFCLEARPILAWLERARARGVDCPVEIGLAGPASGATLAKFAVRCGVAASLGALVKGQTSVTRLLDETGPEAIVAALAAAAPAPVIERLHLFSFGGVAHTAAWRQAVARGDFTLSRGGASFRVLI